MYSVCKPTVDFIKRISQVTRGRTKRPYESPSLTCLVTLRSILFGFRAFAQLNYNSGE